MKEYNGINIKRKKVKKLKLTFNLDVFSPALPNAEPNAGHDTQNDDNNEQNKSSPVENTLVVSLYSFDRVFFCSEEGDAGGASDALTAHHTLVNFV